MNRYFVYLGSFLVGIPLGFGSVSILKGRDISSEVLSKSNEIILSVSPTATITPTPTPSPIPTPTPIIKITPTFTPTPTQRPLITAPADLEPLFEEFSVSYSVDKNKLIFIAKCESNFNIGVWKDPYAGLFQFDEVTWTKYRNLMGKDPNINLRFGARESIETSAFVISIGNERIWPTCSSIY